MKISLITVSYNAEKTIENTIQSVISQDYKNVEYIIIDGLSKDRTLDIVEKYRSRISIIVCEKDKGMYDGINKGIRRSTGDIVGILNADDTLSNDTILSQIANAFVQNPNADSLIADIAFVNDQNKLVRYYSSNKWNPEKFVWGFMPAHPTFYCKRKLFENFGYYRTDFDIAADYELLIRFLKINAVTYVYLPLLMVKMKMGGKSTKNIFSTFRINAEIKKACELNCLHTNYLMLYLKYFKKVFEFFYTKGNRKIVN